MKDLLLQKQLLEAAPGGLSFLPRLQREGIDTSFLTQQILGQQANLALPSPQLPPTPSQLLLAVSRTQSGGSLQGSAFCPSTPGHEPLAVQPNMLDMLSLEKFAWMANVKQEPTKCLSSTLRSELFASCTKPFQNMDQLVTRELHLPQPPSLPPPDLTDMHMQAFNDSWRNVKKQEPVEEQPARQSREGTDSPSENESPVSANKNQRMPRWKRRNNVKHVAGERARRARTSNKVKIIRGLLPKLTANASFNDMIQQVIDIAKMGTPAAKPTPGHNGSVESLQAVKCDDHRAMLYGCPGLVSVTLDRDNHLVEANPTLRKAAHWQHFDGEVAGKSLSSLFLVEHARALADNISLRRSALRSGVPTEVAHFTTKAAVCISGGAGKVDSILNNCGSRARKTVELHVTVTPTMSLLTFTLSELEPCPLL